MVDVVKKLEGLTLIVTNNKINQTQRNTLKADLIEGLSNILKDIEGVEVFRTNEGVVLELVSKKDTVYVVIDPVIKNTDYDLEVEIAEYESKVADRLERERKQAEKKAERLAKTKKAE